MRLVAAALAAAALCGGAGREVLDLEGLVLEVRRARQTIVVSHKEVPGRMPAMVMPVRVADARQMEGLRPGDFVEFQLVIEPGGSKARRLRVRRAVNEIVEEGQRVRLEAPAEQVAIGGAVPEFTLRDQRGRERRLSGLRGDWVVVQFLYTRCPMPEVCPRLAAGFARLQKRFADGGGVTLVSVTLDPVHDTPEVLSRYAAIWRAGERWLFLTGRESEIRRVAGLFGMVYWPEEGVITHTSTIGIIGPDGRLRARVDGLGFTARQLGDLVEHYRKGTESKR